MTFDAKHKSRRKRYAACDDVEEGAGFACISFPLRESGKRNRGIFQFLNWLMQATYMACGHDSNPAPLFAAKQSPAERPGTVLWKRYCVLIENGLRGCTACSGGAFPFWGVQTERGCKVNG